MFGSNASIAEWLSRLCGVAFAALVMAAVPFAGAYANTQQCFSLKRQLASLNDGSGNYARYDAAAEQQSTEIWYIKRDIRDLECKFSNTRQCASLNGTLRKMNANYKALVRKRDAYRNRLDRKAAALQNRIDALRCDSPAAGHSTKTVIVNRGNQRESITVPSIGGGDQYRTMCVRTCDGYYFPVSHASSTGDFKRDEAICNALCPAAESRLFVYKNSQQAQSEEMTSLDGQLYTALPAAFKYRTQPRSPACSCGTADPESVGLSRDQDSGQTALPTDNPALKKLPVPLKRPDLLADPESSKNARTDLTPDTMKQFLTKQTNDEIIAGNGGRSVRVVGPEFLPAPEEAIDLRAPAPTRIR